MKTNNRKIFSPDVFTYWVSVGKFAYFKASPRVCSSVWQAASTASDWECSSMQLFLELAGRAQVWETRNLLVWPSSWNSPAVKRKYTVKKTYNGKQPNEAGMNKGTFIMLDIFLLWTFYFVQSHGCSLDPPPPCPLCHSHAINHSIFCLASNSAGPLADFRNKMQTLASWLGLPSPLP